MAKISKTYTIEEETLNIVRENKEDRNLSSDSASLERIVLEWAVLKGNNNGTGSIRPFQYASPFAFIPSK